MISVIHGLISIMIILSVLILIESCPELCEDLSLETFCSVIIINQGELEHFVLWIVKICVI